LEQPRWWLLVGSFANHCDSPGQRGIARTCQEPATVREDGTKNEAAVEFDGHVGGKAAFRCCPSGDAVASQQVDQLLNRCNNRLRPVPENCAMINRLYGNSNRIAAAAKLAAEQPSLFERANLEEMIRPVEQAIEKTRASRWLWPLL